MVGLGLATGVAFPPFVTLLGVPPAAASGGIFRIACLVAGFLVGGLNYWLTRLVVGRRVRVLSEQLQHVDHMVREATLTGDWSGLSLEAHHLPVDSDDDMGQMAASFNRLLDALEREKRFRALVQRSSDIITVVDTSGTIRYQSPAVQAVLGCSPTELVGQPLHTLLSPTNPHRTAAYLAEIISDPHGRLLWSGAVRHRDGGDIHLEAAAVNLLDDPGVRGIVLTIRDITERKGLEERLRHQAFHHPLTGLPNRALFRDRLQHTLANASRSGVPIAVLLIDIDRFKVINDTLGHSAGDTVLLQVAHRLSAVLRSGDTAAHIGGDEFAILLANADDATAMLVADRLFHALRAPVDAEGSEFFISISVGLAVCTGDGDVGPDNQVDSILGRADVAMYAAKFNGRGRMERYEPAMHELALHRLRLGGELRGAAERQEFFLLYQPVVSLSTGVIEGVEALVRWRHPDRGVVPPLEFIAAAEETGMIVPIGTWILETACREAQSWPTRDGGPPLSVAVNVSGRQIREPDFAETVLRALAVTGMDPRRLVLEVTESVLVEDIEAAREQFGTVRSRGVRIAMDDFGAGYSSLGYLRALPLDIIKIDRMFVAGLGVSEDDRELTLALVHLLRTTSVRIVAEGIETVEQLDCVRGLGIEAAQGYLFSRPIEATALLDLTARPAMDLVPPASADTTIQGSPNGRREVPEDQPA